MATVEEERVAIQAAIEEGFTAAGVEIVLAAEPRIETAEDVRHKIMTPNGNAISYVHVRRVRSTPMTGRQFNVPMGMVHYAHLFRASLFYAWKDQTSEEEMQLLVDSILETFRDRRSLGSWNTEQPLGLDEVNEEWLRLFIYSHRAQFSVVVISVHEADPY